MKSSAIAIEQTAPSSESQAVFGEFIESLLRASVRHAGVNSVEETEARSAYVLGASWTSCVASCAGGLPLPTPALDTVPSASPAPPARRRDPQAFLARAAGRTRKSVKHASISGASVKAFLARVPAF